ncbi:hypothetical protein [Bradyrhizobium sp. STM 3557]|uniref:hypothetical protein n=1 Tax=Bradyrhizobium sp. STM 3557 TaxID=578920 RepID=UPI00388F8AF2
MTTILAIGLDPISADLAAFPQFTPEMLRSYIDGELDRVRAAGFEVVSCLIDGGDTAAAVVADTLRSRRFDCVVIGAGLRLPPEQLVLFETVVNLVHRLAPDCRIAFNSRPADTLDAVRRALNVP